MTSSKAEWLKEEQVSFGHLDANVISTDATIGQICSPPLSRDGFGPAREYVWTIPLKRAAKVQFTYYVSTFIAQKLISLPNFSQKLLFFRENKGISFSTLHFDKIFMIVIRNV